MPVEKENNTPRIKRIVALCEVFTDGERVTAAALEYDRVIDGTSLRRSSFSVAGRRITGIYTNKEPARSRLGAPGAYVIIELSPDDEEARTIVEADNDHDPDVFRKEILLQVKQLENIRGVDGSVVPASAEELTNDAEIDPPVDLFEHDEFRDERSEESLRYSLFRPQGYDPDRSYPLIVFIHDRGVCSRRSDLGLVQGLGGVVWAGPGEQKKHECMVLVPHFPKAIVNDAFETTVHFELALDLIGSIVDTYSVDRSRIYGVGQSMGTMSLLEMGIRRPDLFAGMLLAAGQWNPATISPIAENKIWVIVSEGDTRAYNGMNACMDALEAVGAEISRAVWDGGIKGSEAEALAREQKSRSGNIKYSVFRDSTIVPENELKRDDIPPMLLNHMWTWRRVFTVETLRDWLFEQVG